MKKLCEHPNKVYSLILFFAMFTICLVASASASSSYYATYTNDEGRYSISFDYADELLLSDAKGSSVNLEKASIALSSLAYTNGNYYPDSLVDLLNDMGYERFNCINYTQTYKYPDCNHVAFTVCDKRFSYNQEDYYVILVAVRGTVGFNGEWFSNLNVGTGSEHAGFSEAAQEVLSAIIGRVTYNGIDPDHNIVWITGHSRGAAVSNLVSGKLTSRACGGTLPLLPSHIHSYNFACPPVSKNADVTMANIHNYNNPFDLVPSMPPPSWNYKRFGQNYDRNEEFVSTDFEYYFQLGHDREFSTCRPDVILIALKDIIANEYTLNVDANHLVVDILIKSGIAQNTDVTWEEIFRKYDKTYNFIATVKEESLKICDSFRDTIDNIVSAIDDYVSNGTSKASTGIAFSKACAFLGDVKYLLNTIIEDFDGQKQGVNDEHTPETYMSWIGQEDYSVDIKQQPSGLYCIPYGITTLNNYFLSGNQKITKVIVPSSVRYVGDYCFTNCTSLEEIVFEGSIESIGVGCFDGCPKLKLVNYDGPIQENPDITPSTVTWEMPGIKTTGDFYAWADYNKNTLTLTEVGMFISSNRFALETARVGNFDANRVDMKNDAGTVINDDYNNSHQGLYVYYNLSKFILEDSTTYYYKFYSVDTNGNIVYSQVAQHTTPASPIPVVTGAVITEWGPDSYVLTITATDDVAVTKISIGTWHDQMSIDVPPSVLTCLISVMPVM